jgi:tryptophan 2,3-dioxygenase
MVSQVDILETMTPLDFHSFRSRLQASSGFQSFQFRAFEFLLGKRSAKFLDYYPDGSDERLKLEKLMAGPNLFDHFLIHLKKQGYAIPDGAFSYNGRNPSEVFEPIHETLFQLYKTDPLRTQLCELMIDLDEGVQEWRYRHVKMVERTIGMKMGTGGSPGSAYLRQTLFASVFPDLWAIRDKF